MMRRILVVPLWNYQQKPCKVKEKEGKGEEALEAIVRRRLEGIEFGEPLVRGHVAVVPVVGSALVHDATAIHVAFFRVTETERVGRMSPASRRRAWRTNNRS